MRRRVPPTQVFGSALVRTLGLQPDVDKIVAPCLGVIRLQWGEAVRRDDAELPPTLFDV